MTKILLIESSLGGDSSTSNTLARELVKQIEKGSPEARVKRRNLVESPVPHLDIVQLSARFAAAEDHSEEQRRATSFSDELIDELQEAEIVVVAAPMYNFSIPSTLKAWIDHVAVAGKTFHYTAEGPVGHLSGKRVYLVVSRGSLYDTPQMAPKDFQAPYLKQIFEFLGVTDIQIVSADGQSVSPEHAEAGKARAHQRVEELTGGLLTAAE